MKGIKRLTERMLNDIVSESVRRVLDEEGISSDANGVMDDLRRIVSPCRKILSSRWFSLLKKYQCNPVLSIQPYDGRDLCIDSLIFDSDDIGELAAYATGLKDKSEVKGIRCFFYADCNEDEVPEIIYNIWGAAYCGCFNVEDYGYYEKMINKALKAKDKDSYMPHAQRQSMELERQATEKMRNLGSYGIIEVRNAPSRFNRYLRIEKNESRNTYAVCWDYNFGFPAKSVKFDTPEEVVAYLKENNVDLSSLQTTVDPLLTNGL